MTAKLCDGCKAFLVDLLDKRINRILEVGRAELAAGANEDDAGIGQSHCFHLMEIKRIIEGKTTCGVFDDYGKPEASEGPTA